MIKKYRELRNLTQEQLAEKLDLTPRQVQRLENGSSTPTMATLRLIIKILDVSDEDIVKYIKDEED